MTFKNVGSALRQYVENQQTQYPTIRRATSGFPTTPTPLRVFLVINPARVWVINPTARCKPTKIC